ncbi:MULTISPECIES: 5-formyltetrahydrofolate cyclo-ligase [unclassified Neorhizobium]|uniref:5-formyltetrahydrofolate cyclo-ligase n=1 Tax=unclassified Neorhizobium TaxID=2629175 RepID=UPI000CF89852|nr:MULTISPECIES: 5-formyltetrahydrofolate cyclo-ligase [unclassified Neorhizobium]
MSNENEKELPAAYASPACLMHEVDPVYMGLGVDRATINAWRRDERRRLIDLRTLLSSEERQRRTLLLRQHLDKLLPNLGGRNVSFYWPFLGEPDLRGWIVSASAGGAIGLLPVVTERRKPLTFRTWSVGEELEQGVLNIPVPRHGQVRRPDIIIAPLVGFDAQCYRLGFGGGYFDRTLAALDPPPLKIGVGFEFQEIESIRPQAHDIPMDAIVTDVQVRVRPGRDAALRLEGEK